MKEIKGMSGFKTATQRESMSKLDDTFLKSSALNKKRINTTQTLEQALKKSELIWKPEDDNFEIYNFDKLKSPKMTLESLKYITTLLKISLKLYN